MFSSDRRLLAVLLLATSAAAQEDARSRLRPITAPIRRAGVFHVATGNWTRGASLANVTGPDVVYNNSCSAVYFTNMLTNEQFQHRSRIPSPSGPTTDSLFYGTSDANHRWDDRPGCAGEYRVNGFEIAYCSSHVGPWEMTHRFTSSWIPSASSNCTVAPVFQYTFVLTGLPGGTPTGAQNCWIVDVDLSGGSEFLFSADGDGTYTGPRTQEQFGWGFSPTTVTINAVDQTGPVIAGNFTWTGGPGTTSGPLSPCTGADGTIWDDPVDVSEPGTGMSSDDFFRIPGTCSPTGVCCYYFGGNPHADFYLKLFADTGCPPDPMAAFCFPDVGGVRSCPCGNPPSAGDLGCDHFTSPGTTSGSGGARLVASGIPVASPSSTLVFHVTRAHNPASNSNLHVFWKGTSILPGGVKSGFGVRCVAGALRRMYQGTGTGSGGLGSTNAIDFPNGVQTTDAWTASQMPAGGTTLYYFDSFRDQQGPTNCFTANHRYNVTPAGAIVWIP